MRRSFAILLVACLFASCGEDPRAPAPDGPVPDPGLGILRVEVAPARVGRLENRARATGMVSPWQEANLRAEVAGRVHSISAKNGDIVAEGQRLLTIDGTRARISQTASRAQLQGLEQDLELAETEHRRNESLQRKGALSQAALDQSRTQAKRARASVRAARANLAGARRGVEDTVIDAPFAGTVAGRMVDLGDNVVPGEPLLAVVDLSRVRVRVGLAGSELGRLQEAGSARASIDDLGGESLDAEFMYAAPSADPITGLFEVEYAVSNDDGSIRGGMVATVDVPLAQDEPRILVPRDALTRRDGTLAVFVAEGENEGELRVARLRRVRTGSADGEFVEIIEGLREDEMVVVGSLHAVADGMTLEVSRVVASAPDKVSLSLNPEQTP